MWCHTLEMVCLREGFGFKGGGKAKGYQKLLSVIVLSCSERCRSVRYVSRTTPSLGVSFPAGDVSSNTTTSNIQRTLPKLISSAKEGSELGLLSCLSVYMVVCKRRVQFIMSGFYSNFVILCNSTTSACQHSSAWIV